VVWRVTLSRDSRGSSRFRSLYFFSSAEKLKIISGSTDEVDKDGAMPLSVGSNRASLIAQRRLGDTTDALSRTYERLSSGMRINRPSDDPAGLSVVASLNLDSRIANQGIKNLNDGISLLNIAEGALLQLSSIATRQEELAEQAANGVYGLSQRKALQAEAQALTEEYNRIIESTEYNGIRLLDGGLSNLRVQGGYGADGGLTLDLGDLLSRSTGTGSFHPVTSFAAGVGADDVAIEDYNRDGIQDIAVSNQGAYTIGIMIGNGDGSFKNQVTFVSAGNIYQFSSLDVNRDNIFDIVTANTGSGSVGVMIGNGDGTFKSSTLYSVASNSFAVEFGDINGDGVVDLATADYDNPGTVSILMGNGDGTFKAYSSYASGVNSGSIAMQDLNGDSRLDIVTPSKGNDSVSVLINNGDGTFRISRTYRAGDGAEGVALFDANGDGVIDIATADSYDDTISILFGNGDGTFRARVTMTAGDGVDGLSVADLNGDGYKDIIGGNDNSTTLTVVLGNGDGTFKAMTTISIGNNPWISAIKDLNGDGALDIVAALQFDNKVGVLLGEATKTALMPTLNLLTQTSARETLETVKATRERVGAELGVIGAAQSRFATAVRNLQTQRENTQAASSRISDVDVAEESARLVSYEIRQQAATAILSQANSQPALALRLLQG